jgi:hypothetical protein
MKVRISLLSAIVRARHAQAVVVAIYAAGAIVTLANMASVRPSPR